MTNVFVDFLRYINNMFVTIWAREGSCKIVEKLVNENVPCIEISYQDLIAEQPMHFVARAYLNPQTKTGPNYEQTIGGRSLHFTLN